MSRPPLDIDPDWLYSVEVQNVALEGLISVGVSVQSAADTSLNPQVASLTRWMIDPSVATLTDDSSTTTGGAGG